MTEPYAELQVPGPTTTDLTEPFWAAAQQGRLSGQRCNDCGKAVFYPRAICPHCWSDKLDWEAWSGEGTLKSFSEVWKPGHPGWLPVTPYLVGLVRLAEGPTMLSHILRGDAEPAVGEKVFFAPTKVNNRILPFFSLHFSL